jgi:hypothetical protein
MFILKSWLNLRSTRLKNHFSIFLHFNYEHFFYRYFSAWGVTLYTGYNNNTEQSVCLLKWLHSLLMFYNVKNKVERPIKSRYKLIHIFAERSCLWIGLIYLYHSFDVNLTKSTWNSGHQHEHSQSFQLQVWIGYPFISTFGRTTESTAKIICAQYRALRIQ